MTPQEREELKRIVKDVAYNAGDIIGVGYDNHVIEIEQLFSSHIDHILETRAQALEGKKNKLQDTGGMTGHWIAGQKKALDDAISIIRGKSDTDKLLEKGAKHFAENFTDTITRLADE